MKFLIPLILSCFLTFVSADEVYFAQKYFIPQQTFTPSLVADSTARLVNSAPVSSLVDYSLLPASKTFSTLIGSSSPQQVHLIIFEIPSSSFHQFPLINSKTTNKIMLQTTSGEFPASKLASSLRGSSIISSSVSFQNAFLGSNMITSPVSFPDLASCGVTGEGFEQDGSFSLFGVKFSSEDTSLLSELSSICSLVSSKPANDVQLLSIGVFAYSTAMEKYGAENEKTISIAKATDEILSRYLEQLFSTESHSEVVFYLTSKFIPEVIEPEVKTATTTTTTNAKAVGTLLPSDKNTAMSQILIWTTVILLTIMLSTFIATLGIGVDVERDSLLYRTTSTFH